MSRERQAVPRLIRQGTSPCTAKGRLLQRCAAQGCTRHVTRTFCDFHANERKRLSRENSRTDASKISEEAGE